MAVQSAYFMVENLNGKRDAGRIKQGLDTLLGVTAVSVNTDSGRLAVDFDDTAIEAAAIRDTLDDMGFTFCPVRAPRSDD